MTRITQFLICTSLIFLFVATVTQADDPPQKFNELNKEDDDYLISQEETRTDDQDYETNTNEDMLQLFDRMEEVMKRLNFLSHNRLGDD